MAGISFIMHKGVKIAYQDWSYCKPDEILNLIQRARSMVVHSAEKFGAGAYKRQRRRF